MELVIPERGGAGIAVHEQEKEEVPDVLKAGMSKMVVDNAFLEEVETIRKKVRNRTACLPIQPPPSQPVSGAADSSRCCRLRTLTRTRISYLHRAHVWAAHPSDSWERRKEERVNHLKTWVSGRARARALSPSLVKAVLAYLARRVR